MRRPCQISCFLHRTYMRTIGNRNKIDFWYRKFFFHDAFHQMANKFTSSCENVIEKVEKKIGIQAKATKHMVINVPWWQRRRTAWRVRDPLSLVHPVFCLLSRCCYDITNDYPSLLECSLITATLSIIWLGVTFNNILVIRICELGIETREGKIVGGSDRFDWGNARRVTSPHRW